MYPVSIKVKEKKYFQITWSDESVAELKLSNLRRNCPCAICLEERKNESSSYIPIYSEQQLELKSIQQIGSYAVGLTWGDDHNTGIYDYGYLKILSEQMASK